MYCSKSKDNPGINRKNTNLSYLMPEAQSRTLDILYYS